MSDRVSDVDDNDLTQVEDAPATEPVAPSISEASAANADEAAAPGNEPGAGDSEAPGLVQGLDAVSASSESSKRRVVRRPANRQSIRKSSELIAAEQSAASADIRLSAAEERDVKDLASSDEDAAELREELISAKRQSETLRQAKKKVNPAVPVHILSSRPSYATTSASIEYHTREAFAFLLGRSRSASDDKIVRVGEVTGQENLASDDKHVKKRITGLFESNSKVREIVQGYYAGCPYAAWYLIRIEDEIRNIREQVDAVKARADQLVGVTALQVNPLTVRLPAQINLTFHAAYGYHFADLLTAYDNLIRKVKPYMMMNFISYEKFREIEKSLGTPLRRLYRLPMEWNFVGRDAVLQKTAVLFAAEYRMGILPENILTGERKPTMVRNYE